MCWLERRKKREHANTSNLPCVQICMLALAERMKEPASSEAVCAASNVLPAHVKASLFKREKPQ